MNLANKITLFRVCLIPLFLVILLGNWFSISETRIIATAIFVIASATDALDGYIARSRNMITNFGKFMDPLADKLLVCSALIAMIQLGDLPSWIVILIISREFIITGFRLVASDQNIVIAASVWGKAKTITQMVMIVVVLSGLNQINDLFYFIGSILIWLSVFFTVLSAVDYIYKNRTVLTKEF